MSTCIADLLNLPAGFQVVTLLSDATQMSATIASTATAAPCPRCGTSSTHLHSNYMRHLADVPCVGQVLRLQVQTHKWRCQNPTCVQQVFAERLLPLTQVQARMTQRYRAAVQQLGLFVNGEGGVRLGQHLGICTSPTTLLRQVMALPDPDMLPPVGIGVDEWAYRRGQRYGTIIVDRQRRCVIDLLPDREASTVAAWLRAHPTIRQISRDRSREFATAIAHGAPQAVQVLDRWHLLKNLTDLLPNILGPCIQRLRHRSTPPHQPTTSYLDPMLWKPLPAQHLDDQRLARQHDRNRQYEQVVALKQQGYTTKAVAYELRMSVRTVTRWLATFRHDTRRRKRASIFDPFAPYVLERWQAGCHNSLQIWRELGQRGFTGSYQLVHRFLNRLRYLDQHEDVPRIRPPATLPLHRYTLTQLQWLLTWFPEEVRPEAQEDVAWFCTQDTTIASVYAIVQAFRRLVQERLMGQLDQWANLCEASAIPEFQRFVRHLREEWPYALAASTLNASNGQTEGHVNKLKLIKRQHYGRAGFPLLRKRVLHAVS